MAWEPCYHTLWPMVQRDRLPTLPEHLQPLKRTILRERRSGHYFRSEEIPQLSLWPTFFNRIDHQPLSYLFNETKGISQTASSRIQRWALTLSAYQYTIRYKAGKSLSNADALSRLPRPVTTSSDKLPGDLVHLTEHLSATAVNAEAIKNWTSKDPILSKVRKYLMVGWPDNVSADLKPYQNRSR